MFLQYLRTISGNAFNMAWNAPHIYKLCWILHCNILDLFLPFNIYISYPTGLESRQAITVGVISYLFNKTCQAYSTYTHTHYPPRRLPK